MFSAHTFRAYTRFGHTRRNVHMKHLSEVWIFTEQCRLLTRDQRSSKPFGGILCFGKSSGLKLVGGLIVRFVSQTTVYETRLHTPSGERFYGPRSGQRRRRAPA